VSTVALERAYSFSLSVYVNDYSSFNVHTQPSWFLTLHTLMTRKHVPLKSWHLPTSEYFDAWKPHNTYKLNYLPLRMVYWLQFLSSTVNRTCHNSNAWHGYLCQWTDTACDDPHIQHQRNKSRHSSELKQAKFREQVWNYKGIWYQRSSKYFKLWSHELWH
jgi:hypothetical protein